MATTIMKRVKRMAFTNRIRQFLVLVALVATAIWITFVTIMVVFPEQGEVHHRTDAVVSLAPQYSRLTTAEELVATNHVDTLVISYLEGDVRGPTPGHSRPLVSVANYCETGGQDGVVCFTPEEITTIGEAFSVRYIAEAASWEAVTVVTSRSHAFRARFIFERCVGDGIEVDLVYADPDLNLEQWGWHIAYENAAFLKALWQTGTRC